MGKKMTLKKCAAAVKKKRGSFFVLGTGRKKGWCYLERTKSAACTEGFKKDLYNFYALGKKPATEAYIVKAGA